MNRKLSAVGLPLLTLLITAALGLIWAMVHKTRLETYYTDLAYRTLADIANTIRDRVYQYDVALYNSCKDWNKTTQPCMRWEEVVRLQPSLLGQAKPNAAVPRSQLVFELHGAKVTLDLQMVASQMTTDFFDDLILCDSASNVLYQKSQYGQRVVKCSSVLSRAGHLRDGKEKEAALSWVLPDEAYPFRVYEHQVELEPPKTGISLGSAKPDSEPIRLTVVGLVRKQRLESEVLAFPFTLTLTFVFVVFVAFLSIPMVRVSLLRPNQRLRRWDGAWLTASTFFTASLMTFGLLTLVCYRFEWGQGIDRRLSEIAEQVQANAGSEFKSQRSILAAVMAEAASLCGQGRPNAKASESKALCPEREESPAGKLREFVVYGKDKPVRDVRRARLDATLDLVVFAGPNGMQVTKWTMQPDAPAPLINIKDRRFFRAVMENRMWRHDSVPFFLEALISRTTAENVVVQSMPAADMVLSITSRPASLFGVFLQPGFGFAIIDQVGEILFHSEQSRNLQENLFDDCMDTAELKSAVHGRAVRTVDANYLGRDHRFHITPLHSFVRSPWTLVVYYDQEHLRSTLAGVITVTLALFMGYTLLATLGLTILATLGFVRNVSVSGFANPVVLLWPDEGTHGNYVGLIAWFATLLAVDLIALATLGPLAVCAVVTIMPLIAMTLSGAWLRFFRWQKTPWLRHLSLHRRYTVASAFLLILTAVAPCTAFFRVAYDYEMSLLVRHEITALMRHMRDLKTAALADKKFGDAHLKHRIESGIQLGVYSCVALAARQPKDRSIEGAAECPFPTRYSWMRRGGRPVTALSAWPAPVKQWFPGLYDSHAEDRFGAANSVDPNWEPDAVDLALNANDPYLSSVHALPQFLMPSPGAFAGFLVLVALIFAWMFFLNRRLFLFDLADALTLSHTTPLPPVIDANFLVLVSPCEDQELTRNRHGDLCEIDLAAETCELAIERIRGTDPSIGVILRHFEDRIDIPEVLENRIQLIELLTTKLGRHVVVVSAVDPGYHLAGVTDPQAQKHLARLNSVLAGFTRRTVFHEASEAPPAMRRGAHA